MKSRPAPSLKGRALRHLSRREHSRLELHRKLLPHAESEDQLERLLDELERAGWLSNERFAESVVHRKAGRFGSELIRHELRGHAIDEALFEDQLATLRETELDRARALWQRRFGTAADSPQARARQYRFLRARGFAADVVHKVIGSES